MMSGKRGAANLVLLTIGSAVLAVIVFVAIPEIARACSSGKIALKVVAARDIALLLDAMYAYPYDIEVEYDVDLSDLKIKINQNRVNVELVTLIYDQVKSNYPYVAINDDPDFELIKPKKIIFKKENGKIKCSYLTNNAMAECA